MEVQGSERVDVQGLGTQASMARERRLPEEAAFELTTKVHWS